jgi:hypothetical protein
MITSSIIPNLVIIALYNRKRLIRRNLFPKVQHAAFYVNAYMRGCAVSPEKGNTRAFGLLQALPSIAGAECPGEAGQRAI